jgi:hypothetical protein
MKSIEFAVAERPSAGRDQASCPSQPSLGHPEDAAATPCYGREDILIERLPSKVR